MVTAYKNIKTNKGNDVNLLDWLTNPSNKEAVLITRKAYGTQKYIELKSLLPCATISGTFKVRNNEALIKHSGYICIDIDGKDNPEIKDYNKLREAFKNIVNISYASLSAGGNGLFCLIPLSKPDNHRKQFLALKKTFEALGIIIDKQCGEVARLRIGSYDPEAFSNEDAVAFTEIAEEDKPVRKSKKSKEKSIEYTLEKKFEEKDYDGSMTKKKVLDIIDKIIASKKDITGTYGDWFKLACSLCSEFGHDGRILFHEISKFNSQYKPHECDTVYTNVEKAGYNRISIRTFFFYAQQHGL
jgi:hypothetical protein